MYNTKGVEVVNVHETNNLCSEMGKRISQRRKQLGLSQEELSARADVSPQMLSTAERGTKSILSENLLKISGALGVSADYLLTGKMIESDVNELAGRILSASPETQGKIEKIIDILLDG